MTTYGEVFLQARKLLIDDSRTESRCQGFPLSVPPSVVHLGEQCISTQGLEAFILCRRLGPVLVGNFGNEGRFAYVDSAVPGAIPLPIVVSLDNAVKVCNLLTVWNTEPC